MSCTENKAQKTEVSQAEFSLSDCGGTYKGKPLPFGKPIEEWEKLFGKPTRKQYDVVFIWDNIGVMIWNMKTTKDDEYSPDYEIRKHDQLYIFFSNLDSPVGQKGKLKFANGRRSFKDIIDMYERGEGSIPLTNELRQEFKTEKSIGGKEGPDKYIYPYTTYKKSISIDGALINSGMSLKELNENRKSKDLEIFSFRDNNLDGVNQWGDTKEEDGEYWNGTKRDICPTKKTYTINIAQFSSHELEFIKIEFYDKK